VGAAHPFETRSDTDTQNAAEKDVGQQPPNEVDPLIYVLL